MPQIKHPADPSLRPSDQVKASSVLFGLVIITALIVASAAWMGGSLSAVGKKMSGAMDGMARSIGLSVERVEIEGVSGEHESLVRAAVMIEPGENMFRADPVKIAERVEATGAVTHVRVYRLWPDTILVVATPIWLGQMSSECVKVIERLYAQSGDLNDQGQSVFYGRVGGCLVTGNEDGAKHCSMHVLYSLQHLGFVIPPQADAYWLGEAGPGKSFRSDDSPGPDNDFTRRNTTFMTWNLLHLARMLRAAGGIPAHGNQPEQWKDGERFGCPPADVVRDLEGGPSQRRAPAR